MMTDGDVHRAVRCIVAYCNGRVTYWYKRDSDFLSLLHRVFHFYRDIMKYCVNGNYVDRLQNLHNINYLISQFTITAANRVCAYGDEPALCEFILNTYFHGMKYRSPAFTLSDYAPIIRRHYWRVITHKNYSPQNILLCDAVFMAAQIPRVGMTI